MCLPLLCVMAFVLLLAALAAATAAPPPPIKCDPHASPVEFCPGGAPCPSTGLCPQLPPLPQQGTLLRVWNSSAGVLALDAPPAVERALAGLNFSIDTAGAPFSAEVTGSLVVAPGNYSFSLSATGVGLTAMIWIDGHLVARSAPAGRFLAGHDLGGSGKRDESVDDVLAFGKFPNAALGGGLDPSSGKYRKAVVVRVWHTPLNDSATGGHTCTKWVHNGDCAQQEPDPADPDRITIAVSYSEGATAHAARLAKQRPLTPAMLTPELPPEHVERLALQKNFSGWNTWIPDNKLALVDYASGAVVTTMLCQVSTGVCMTVSQIEARNDHDPFGVRTDIRVGAHAWDASYAQSYNSWVAVQGDPKQGTPTVSGTKLNASVEWSGGAGGELNGVVTLVDHRDGAGTSTTATNALVIDGYDDIGNGFCTGPKGRPQSYLCDTTSSRTGCPASAAGCGALCTADSACTGFMWQTMGSDPSTCNLVTTNTPGGGGTWEKHDVDRHGTQISGHDQETRDECYRRRTSPGPPSPPTGASNSSL